MGSELARDHGRLGRTWKVSVMVWMCESRKRDSSPPPAAFFARPPFFDIAAAVAVVSRGWEAEDGEEETTGTRGGAAAVEGFMRLGLRPLDVGVARAVGAASRYVRSSVSFISP